MEPLLIKILNHIKTEPKYKIESIDIQVKVSPQQLKTILDNNCYVVLQWMVKNYCEVERIMQHWYFDKYKDTFGLIDVSQVVIRLELEHAVRFT